MPRFSDIDRPPAMTDAGRVDVRPLEGLKMSVAVGLSAKQRHPGRATHEARSRVGLVWRLTEFINANLAASLPLRLLAAQFHLSAFYFARLFKDTTGIAPHQFVIHLRLAAAERLLTHTVLPIADIAYRTGFSSQSQMAKLFRRRTNMTPIEYRRSKSRMSR
jgi:AraC-like DNA-binding protein